MKIFVLPITHTHTHTHIHAHTQDKSMLLTNRIVLHNCDLWYNVNKKTTTLAVHCYATLLCTSLLTEHHTYIGSFTS